MLQDNLSLPTTIISDSKSLRSFVRGLDSDSVLSFDTETTGLSIDDKLICASFYQHSTKSKCAVFIDNPNIFSGVPLNEFVDIIKPILQTYPIICHNAKFDVWVMKRIGIDNVNIVDDTMLMIHCFDGNLLKQLEASLKRDLKISKPTYSEICGLKFDKIDWEVHTKPYSTFTGKKNIVEHFHDSAITKENLGVYAADDTHATYLLYEYWKPRILKDEKIYSNYKRIELPLINCLVDMKHSGVKIDLSVLDPIEKSAVKRLQELENAIYDYVGYEFNIGSSKQLSKILYEDLRYPVPSRTDKGAPSTDKHSMKKLAEDGYELASMLSEHSAISTLLASFLQAVPKLLDKDGRLRGDLNSAGTVTGRFSSSNPNMQNAPNNNSYPFRSAYVPKEGCVFVGFDFSQIEPRILAHVTKDKKLSEVFVKGNDIYQSIADAVNITRKQSKVLVLAIMYGMGADSVAASLQITKKQADKFLSDFFQKYSEVTLWKNYMEDKIKKDLFSTTIFGRKRKFKYANAEALRQGVNSIIQGSAADIMKLTMIRVYKCLKEKYPGAVPVMSVHDELIVETPIEYANDVYKDIKHIAENQGLRVPVKVDIKICTCWSQMKDDNYHCDDVNKIFKLPKKIENNSNYEELYLLLYEFN